MRSDFIPSDVQDANERRRQPVPAFSAAPSVPSESFASILLEPRERAHQKAQLAGQVAAAPPGPPASPFKGISAFTGAPAVIPSAVVPPVEALTTASEPTSPEASSPPAFAAAEPTPAETAPSPALPAAPAAPAAPALATLSGRREPIPAFAAAKPESSASAPPAPVERVQGNAAFGATAVTAEESLALANGDASSFPKAPSLFGDEGMTTADFFSIINPLQHLPLIGALYRDLTGDTIKPGARVLGGLLFGGPIGMVGGAFNAGVEHDIGTDAGGALLALARGKPLGGSAAPSTTLASAPEAAVNSGAAPAATLALPQNPAAPNAQPSPQAAAPAPVAASVTAPAPLPVSAPRVMSPPRPTASPALAVEASAEPAKPAIPVSFAPAAPMAAPVAAPAQAQTAAPAAAPGDPRASGFALSPGGREFPVPARTNNVQPRQPVPNVRADLSRTRELAPMAPLTVRSDASRPDRSVSPAQLLTPGLNQTDMTPGMPMSGASSTRTSPVSAVPLGVPGLPPSALPDAMTKALDKYDALLKSRKGGVLNQQS